jgi:PAS domain S-box-containing protein
VSNELDFKALVEAAGDAIVAASPDGSILLWNRAAERIFGFSKEEALGRSLDLIIPEAFRTRHWEGYGQVMRTGRTRYGVEVLRVPAMHKDGRRLSIAFTVTLLFSPSGDVPAIAAIVRDETTPWNEERALLRRVAELEARLR